MRLNENFLILKGEIPILQMLEFLEGFSHGVKESISNNLSLAAKERVSENQSYEPWQIFGHIAASGNAGYAWS
jgi:hypothetical protein